MPKLDSLITKLSVDYPELTFTVGKRPLFRPPHTVFYTPNTAPLTLLHEIGHYLTKRYDYTSDIELIRIESVAWQHAKTLATKYQIAWDEDFAQDRLDSYRDWLHNASLCSQCQISGHQDNSGQYHCPLCGACWPAKPLPSNP